MMKLHSLYAKLSIGLVISLLVVGLSYTLFVDFITEKYTQSAQQDLNQNLASQLVADKKIVHNGEIDEDALKQTFMQYMSINPSIEIYYLDLQGNIISYSAEPGRVKRNSVALEPISAFLGGSAIFPLLGDDPRSHDRIKPFSVTIIPDKQNPQGYLYVVLQGEEFIAAYEKQTQNYIFTLAGTVLAGSLFLGLLMGLFSFKRLTLPLRELQHNVSKFASSDFHDPVIFNANAGITSGDEIAELQHHIENMSARITEQWRALKYQDKLRRDMVANISHDLRTPLASLQGYLETILLKKSELDREEQDKYLAIAIKQTQRLHKLINQLFELAKLEAREHAPDCEVFSIMELIYDVVNKLAMYSDAKNIEMTIDGNEDNPMVLADIGLIERVLENLINNAIYYTPEKGKISIQLNLSQANSVRVIISDTGPGISDQQKELIFERFHQAHTPERSSEHAGLGLAIVKKIIELHEQDIWVDSPQGQGSTFNFTLPAA
ncbi:MAG: sensor histidine kinase [Gammaproteobacteria bacterium]|nr:sensor histidine kinase [Gammaproteobacteria bacterium]